MMSWWVAPVLVVGAFGLGVYVAVCAVAADMADALYDGEDEVVE